MSCEMNFNQKVVLITGAGSGIGKAIAIKFAKLSARLSLLDINEQNLNKVASLHYASDALIKSKGCVVNIASIGATTVGKEWITYYVSKAAVLHFTKCAALELAESGVRVNCISPGPVKTNILLDLHSSQEENDKYWDSFIEDHPLKRLVTAEDIAEMAVFLASEKAKSITGCDYIVDCGMSLTKVPDE